MATWRGKWQPAPLFLPGKLHGQRRLEAAVRGITKSQTRLSKWAHTHNCKISVKGRLAHGPKLHVRVSALPLALRPMHRSPPGSTVSGMFQARRAEWHAIPAARGLSHPGVKHVSRCSCVDRQILHQKLPGRPKLVPARSGVRTQDVQLWDGHAANYTLVLSYSISH